MLSKIGTVKRVCVHWTEREREGGREGGRERVTFIHFALVI